MFQPKAWGPAPGAMTLQIYSVATGKLLRAWTGPTPNPQSSGVQTFGEGLYLDPNTTLSWTAERTEPGLRLRPGAHHRHHRPAPRCDEPGA